MAQLVPVKEKMTTVRDMLQKRSAEIAQAVPRNIDPRRFLRVALTNLQTTPALLDCTPASLFTAVMQAAQWGLELDPVLGQAYLIPYKDKATLIIGYRGLLEMARRHPSIESITGRLVYDHDILSIEYGLKPSLKHMPNLGADRGDIRGAYCVWKLKGSDEPEFVYMARHEIDAIRKRSRAGSSGPWVTDYDMMALKTVLRRASRFWPQTTDLGVAVAIDERQELGLEVPTIDVEPIPPKALADTLPPKNQAETWADVERSSSAAFAYNPMEELENPAQPTDAELEEIRQQDALSAQETKPDFVDHAIPQPIIPAERKQIREEHAQRHETPKWARPKK